MNSIEHCLLLIEVIDSQNECFMVVCVSIYNVEIPSPHEFFSFECYAHIPLNSFKYRTQFEKNVVISILHLLSVHQELFEICIRGTDITKHYTKYILILHICA
jgi:hypothetical protein